MVKNTPVNAGDLRDVGLILGLGRSPGEGNGNPLKYSCLENPMGRGAWQATVHTWSCKELDMTKRLTALNFLRVFRPIVSFDACSNLVFFVEAPKAQRG